MKGFVSFAQGIIIVQSTQASNERIELLSLQVKLVELHEVTSQRAYMLFYSRSHMLFCLLCT
jgi:hypothetical protein